ncbi:50S ribosomal protein L11 methyltransferase [Neolewinella aurantiaca]|uniref:Ribosomal protein L11 methyltransferase n=1 Tax=Neolewinella aurantiaca TaxID=2602767 RepID=A0A5C7FR61_9BACT|nr:50S ribosomal protein L11 methyltransferase [Neolewinella aurantiaca]TXF90403.1 50S ribosomal protein L11 methyltransferase [Neolewinella aurantiaca]
MIFQQYTLDNDPALNEVLVAFLSEAGFDSFQETDEGLLAFAPAEDHARWVRELDELSGQFPFTYTSHPLEDKNWNEEWEKQFQPLQIGDRLYIRADFHPPHPNIEQELVITPKMAFGTGHHPTTHMMCELIFEQDLAGKRVFDYGSGTGVLAILAKRLGAAEADAVDIESWSAENTLENARRNGVEMDQIIHGTLDDVPAGEPYDLILANINRNVILTTAEALYQRLRPGGTVLFSGILDTDEHLLVSSLSSLGFVHQETRQRADWRAFVFTRN